MSVISESIDDEPGNDSYDLPEEEEKKEREDEKNRQIQAYMRARAKGFWKECLSSEVGREEIWKLLVEYGTFRLPFDVTDSSHPYEQVTFFNLGMKQAGELLLKKRLFVYDRQGVLKMFDEHDPYFQDITKGVLPPHPDD